ncbi:polysaccharide biosynthesis/export family protein [Trichothermofontia sp.]
MEMQDFLRYLPPMAALSVAGFAGGHLLQDPAAPSQNPRLPVRVTSLPENGKTASAPQTPASTDPGTQVKAISPTHAANLPASLNGLPTPIAAPDVIAPEGSIPEGGIPEGAILDTEALLLASNEPYPIPNLPTPPSLSEIFAQAHRSVPVRVSLDPALVQASVQALSDMPLADTITAEVASAREANRAVASIDAHAAPTLTGDLDQIGGVARASVADSIAPPETLATPIPSARPSAASIPGNVPASSAVLATASTPTAALHPPDARPGILVAALPPAETGAALQLAPLHAMEAFGEPLEAAPFTPSRRVRLASPPENRSTETQLTEIQPTEIPPNSRSLAFPPSESAIDIPVPPPESTLVANVSPMMTEGTVNSPHSPLPPVNPSHPTSLLAPAQTASVALDYTLGPGDRIFVDIFNVPEYSKSYQVMVDGTLSLPRIGRITVAGLTLDQASALISDRYRQFFVEPLTTVVLEQARPLTVALSGEVNRPGSYQFKTTETGAFPTLTQAIRQAEGITQTADLRRVEIRRPQANGLEQVIEVNLWDLVQSSNLDQDITLRDGDRVRIAPAPALSPAQRSQLAAANFAPATLQVNVIGEVVRPGVVEITPNTPLNQAILRAGGFVNGRAKRQAVELIRLQPNGTVQRRTIAVDLAAGVNEATNPILQPNDVVLVARSDFARTADVIGQVTAPTLFLLNLLRLF